ncbi:MAG: hypothetical protein AAGI68_12235 [Planctomycetota bacterium]
MRLSQPPNSVVYVQIRDKDNVQKSESLTVYDTSPAELKRAIEGMLAAGEGDDAAGAELKLTEPEPAVVEEGGA